MPDRSLHGNSPAPASSSREAEAEELREVIRGLENTLEAVRNGEDVFATAPLTSPEARTPLQHLRRKRGWTQTELATKAAVSVGTISALENGWKPACRSRRAEDVAAALGVTVKDMLGGHEPDADCAARQRVRRGPDVSRVPSNDSSLRRLRVERDLTQRELADISGTSEQFIRDIEYGWRPPRHSERVVRVAEALEVDVPAILDGYSPPPAFPPLDF